jgi:uroporphyrinogen decarboxylase
MTPRERWRALLRGQAPDRLPCDYWATEEVTRRLLKELACPSERQLWERLGADRLVRVAPRHPRASERTWYLQSLYSVWGVEVRPSPAGDSGAVYLEVTRHPLAGAAGVQDIERYPWPDPQDWDLSQLRAECLQWSDYPILLGSYEPFLLYCRLRGFEQALRDLLEQPALLEAALERIHWIHERIIRRSLETAGDLMDLVWVGEDLGTQQSLLISPRLFRRFLKPRLSAMIELVHSFGLRVFHHDDGAIRPLIPDLIEIGIDILNPIQWRCPGMDRESLARDFGSRLIFHGAVDNQHTLPFGSPEDVRREVEENIRIFARGKGYIVAPCHNIQANTPTANILAMFEAVREFARP